MSLLIGFLTFFLVMNCLFLMLLILIQLPKKEAGAGIAFGGAATDALFGAGSGNALTKLTKYSASIFVAMSVLLSVLNMQAARQGSRRLEQELSRQANSRAVLPTFPTNLTQTPAESPLTNSVTLQTTPAAPANNLLTTPSTAVPATTPAPAAQTPAPTTSAPADQTPVPSTPAPAPSTPAPANPASGNAAPANPAPAK